MTRTLLLATILLLSPAAEAQTIEIYKTDGTVVSYPAEQVSYIGFEAKHDDEPSAPAAAEAVDMALPSGTKWANMNVGAEAPEDYGLYFAWGETVGYGADDTEAHSFNLSNYAWYNGSSSMTKYNISDGKTTLEPDDDAATKNWGSAWRMPTQAEVKELIDNTTSSWTTRNGVNGRVFTADNGNSIFLPAAGYHTTTSLALDTYGIYWVASLGDSYPGNASNLYFEQYYLNTSSDSRYVGFTVRPVLNE